MKPPLCLTTLLLTLYICFAALSPLYGQDTTQPASAGQTSSPAAASMDGSTITIPGPLRSFLRMAGISQKVTQEEVVALLARNVFSQGYEGSPTKGRPTEFLILLMRYVQQARELASLAGSDHVIRVSGCADVRQLLRIIGYRVRQDCGKSSTSLVTSDPERAFLTIDSGFPLPDLEETLQGSKSFAYPFPSSVVPILFTEHDWMTADTEASDSQDLLDKLLRDPLLARLYWALDRQEAETRNFLRQSPGLKALLPDAAVLDFYGSEFQIRGDRVLVPGGTAAESSWKPLVGESPDSPGQFALRLLAKDKGWLAAYYDGIARVNETRQAYFTDTHRLRRCYEALHGPELAIDAARPVFRPAPGLLLLLTRLQWESNGDPFLPGGLDAWKQIFRQKTDSKFLKEWGKRATHWNRPEQVLEGLFAVSRLETDSGPLQIYLTMSELDSKRSQRLSAQTVLLLAGKFPQFSNQYLTLSEFPTLNEASIAAFVDAAEAVNKIPNHTLRGNAMGVFQASIGLWQILARQGQISTSQLNDSWQSVVKPFAGVHSESQLFDAGKHSLRELMTAATGKPEVSEDELIDALAGPQQSTPEGERVHEQLADRIRSVMESQRLVSLDTMLTLGDGLNEMARNNARGEPLIPLARELSEFEMPRPIFTSSERTQWAAGIYNNRHTELQMKTDLTKVIKTPASPEQLEQARGQIAPFLRDTLVGLNYAYYEPPGAQVLRNNPLLVRSHDFSGDTVAGVEQVWQAPLVFGEGTPAGGGAHLVGSLADLPYVLASVEQDFIGPENVQALIWRELVPGLLVSATLPRWWEISRNEVHAVTLYQRAGEELLHASAQDKDLRDKVLTILSDRMLPGTLDQVEQDVRKGTFDEITPADTFYLTAEFLRKYPAQTAAWGPSGHELQELSRQHPDEVSWDRLSRDFGVPHPILAQTYSRELLNVKPFPAFEGYSSRLLAETWDSNNLYWARLADEMNYSPVDLNLLAPQLTRRMVEKIFATDFEDWEAILRAMRETGEEFRQGKNATIALTSAVTH
ncbi:MAG TPA: hypothetical protein VEI26_12560 [Terriglobales bacterium]|nr:hypothetical protein [Terriglobales bacterium]